MKLFANNTIPMRGMLLLALWVGFFGNAFGQISPGDLVKGHAHLEGMSSCTKCHDLGNKVTNEKCLECHTDIRTRVNTGEGFHASSEVKGKDCFSCHSDHHGRTFQIVRFDTKTFDHRLTGYTLTGAHQQQDCKSCHKDEYIESADVRKKENTYLGLQTDCISCHTDVHQNTLSTRDCASCHNTEEFAPAALFDHDKTKFALKGKHQEVDCASCHQVETKNNKEFQKFTGIAFNSCVDCHDDVHEGRLGTNCASCHTEDSFQTIIGSNTFNHNTTNFPLLGKHKRVSCASCHQTEGRAANNVFQDFRNKDINNCVTCHVDVHEGKLGTDCRACHTEDSFLSTSIRREFDHTLTGYPLIGKHDEVDCKKCHAGKMTDPLEHSKCLSCHEDFHKGQFVEEAQPTDCRACHSEEGFSETLFSIERHNEGVFPLEGAHLATPCFACHKTEEEWMFKNIGEACVDCHKNIHEGFLDKKYYPENDCRACHLPEAWTEIEFDHAITEYDLLGKHKEVSCGSCHKAEEAEITFTDTAKDCYACHDNAHDRQFEEEGITDCRRCHGFDQWKPSLFDHNTARFILEGAHLEVSCGECHLPQDVSGKQVIQYKMEKIECAACHL